MGIFCELIFVGLWGVAFGVGQVIEFTLPLVNNGDFGVYCSFNQGMRPNLRATGWKFINSQ